MSRIMPLYSGSSGNCTFVGHRENGILIDVGKSFKQTRMALKAADIDEKSISAVFVTHEHSDHISGINVLAKSLKVPVYCSKGTYNYILYNNMVDPIVDIRVIEEEGIEAGDLYVRPFSTPHDSCDCTGYRVEFTTGASAAIATDLGYISDEVSEMLLGCNAVVLESNYDKGMLQNGPYPYFLKKRIMGDKGHLSNEECSNFLPVLVRSGLSRIILAHLSRENNLPELARITASSSLETFGMKDGIDYLLSVALRDIPTKAVVF